MNNVSVLVLPLVGALAGTIGMIIYTSYWSPWAKVRREYVQRLKRLAKKLEPYAVLARRQSEGDGTL